MAISSGRAPMGMKTTQDILERAAKTALQSALAIVVAAGTGFIDASVMKAAAIAGGAAFISAIHNALLNATSTKD